MICIIAGSRALDDITNPGIIDRAVRRSGFGHLITEVVSGTAQGIDRAGEVWAGQNGIKITRMPADWNTYGKRAGYLRNKAMADYVVQCTSTGSLAGGCIVIMAEGGTPGSKMMIELANHRALNVYVHEEKIGVPMSIGGIR